MNTALLVLDDEPGRAEELCLLLRFLEEPQVVHAEFSNWQAHVEDNSDLRCIFLGSHGDSAQPPVDILYAIRALTPRIPIILIEKADEPLRLPATVEANCGGHLAHPFRHAPLSQILARSQASAQRNGRFGATPARRNIELFRSLTGHSTAILRVRELIQRASPSESTVMLLGESGTGKEVVARNIHYFSNRTQGPFVPVNCGAIPDNLLESELFGHEKGAFTGAISTRRGRFELARGGTLFLDEIGDMPLNMQVKLLRVLQERVFERVGSDRSLEADVRIVAATHRNLEEMIKTGDFREDLYYRLNVFPIEIPSLRERIEDLPKLVEELIERMAHEQGGVRIALTAGRRAESQPLPLAWQRPRAGQSDGASDHPHPERSEWSPTTCRSSSAPHAPAEAGSDLGNGQVMAVAAERRLGYAIAAAPAGGRGGRLAAGRTRSCDSTSLLNWNPR
jgi:sigma-54 specific flagellar transcriptional regulator A